jgi:hypothetical protein
VPKLEIVEIVLTGASSPCMARVTSGVIRIIENTKHQAHKRTASPNLIAVVLFLKTVN